MTFLTPTIDNADPLFALVATRGFYLRHDKNVGTGLSYWQCILLIHKTWLTGDLFPLSRWLASGLGASPMLVSVVNGR